ncbi:MAG: FeoB-associated Cys-rich membrane protein [Ruminococcaceae bacterium]|nr:FeoB-associated Cys-rich membrane protein [Oscillospiraceae bacterium]
MNRADIIVALILAAVIGGAIFYIVKAKKRGQKCIGCPYSKACGSAGNCSGSCGGCKH